MTMEYTFENRKKYFDYLESYLRNKLKKSRYRHTLGVAHTAACMAMRYGVDVDKAYIAGLFHDCAKCLDEKETLKLCKKYDLKLTDYQKENLFIVHGPLGAKIAEYEFGIKDEDILDGVTYHTTGRPSMSLFEKIIYLADFIEANRDVAKDLEPVRALCFVDIDAALYRVLKDMIPYLNSIGTQVDDLTRQTYEYYDKILPKEVKELAYNR